jgi:hypothetical protein
MKPEHAGPFLTMHGAKDPTKKTVIIQGLKDATPEAHSLLRGCQEYRTWDNATRRAMDRL